MKTLLITRTGTVELSKTFLDRPSLLVGRSPVCDIIVRDSSIKPVHFLLEWIGEGEFNSDKGEWALIDVSVSHQSTQSGKGVVLANGNTVVLGLQFQISDEALTETYLQAHALKKSIDDSRVNNQSAGERLDHSLSIVEVIQIRRDSQAVENVYHLNSTHGDSSKERKKYSAFLPFFEILNPRKKESPQVKLSPTNSFQIWNKGELAVPQGGILALQPFDFYSLETDFYEFYIRIVSKINSSKLRPRLWEDPLYRNSLIILFLFLSVYYIAFEYLSVVEDTTPVPPKRVARVEILEVPPPPPPPPKEMTKEPPPPKVQPPPKPVTKPPEAKKAPEAPKKNPAPPPTAAAPKFTKPDVKTPTAGLNSPAPKTDVNKVGLAGLMNKSAPGGAVDPSKIIDTVQSETAQSKNAKIVLAQGQSGTVDPFKKSNMPGSAGSDALTSASTTLQASGPRDSGSVGAVAAQGGRGSGLGGSLGSLSGEGSGYNELGSLNQGFQVSGGLDRETVRRVIMANRRKIERCYNQAITSNPRLAGKVTFRWIIAGASGYVLQVGKTQSELKNAIAFESCLQDVIRAMQFPQAPNGQSTTVIYPFIFTQKHQ